MTLAVRLDDADIVTDLCRVTGVGRVTTRPARRTSRPQACWNVASKRECAHLTRILRQFPLRARKRRDFDIWARAVDRWAASPYDAKAGRAFRAGMAQDAAAPNGVRGRANGLLSRLGG